jgi:hypothetical protein
MKIDLNAMLPQPADNVSAVDQAKYRQAVARLRLQH